MHARHALAVILEGGLLGKQQVAPMRGCVGKPAACFLGELGVAGCTVSAGLPHLSPAEARAAGARSLVIGVANQGGVISESFMRPETSTMR